jgi:HPt (histidine-containing phosphotransfer) domain-containing protein
MYFEYDYNSTWIFNEKSSGRNGNENGQELMINQDQDDKLEVEEVIDRKALMVRLNNDTELLKELIEYFLQSYPHQLQEIEASIANQDAETLRRVAHTLKGSLGNFCANKGYELAYELEAGGIKEEFSHARSVYITLQEEIKVVDRALRLISKEYAA